MNIRIWIALILCALLTAGLFLTACKNWEHNVEKNGILFKKVSQSKGGTIVGFMAENHNIQNFPCEKGWIHFKKNWELLSFQLSEGFTYNNILLPAHTWIHFSYHEGRSGYVCSFPYHFEVQGYLCGGSGGYKGTHTGFYDSGKLRSFFPPDDVTVDGVPCEASLLANINLYENGKLKSCKLAKDYQVDGKTYKSGRSIEFDESGKAD